MSNVTLAILAGGEGSRMGMPKGELHVGDEPILAYLLRRLQWGGPTMLVTAPGRERPPGWEKFDREVVDPVAGLGPLRGVLTALSSAASHVVVVSTVDMPGVRREQLNWLVDQLSARPQVLGVMTRREKSVEPFPAAFRAEARNRIMLEIASGRLSVQGLCDDDEFAVLPAPAEWGESVWTNLNRPEDLRAFLSRE
jgi:molybdopterin-guanine dinucleotide biosynthesis protein A